MLNQSKYIKLTQFKNLFFWDYYTLCNKLSIESNYPILELREVISQRKEFVVIEDQLQYKRCRVQLYGNGVVLRDEVYGSAIKTKKQQFCKQDEFLVAEIDAKFGGYGIVPSSLERAIVSGHYFLFDINKQNLSPDFLGIVSKCNGFSKQVKATGSTNYAAIRPYHVLGYKIPLPSLTEQNALVTAYNDLIEIANNQDFTATTLEQQIETYIFDVLGIKECISNKVDTGLNFVNFRKLSRWDIPFFLNEKTSNTTSKYDIVTYKDLIKSIRNGIAARDYAPQGIRYLKVADIKNNDIVNHSCFFIDRYKTEDILPINTILITRKGTVGQSAVVREHYYTASSEVFIIQLDTSRVNAEYFSEINLSQYVQKQYVERYTGTIMPSMSQDKLMTIGIPIPPLEIQDEIVAHITGLKGQIKQLRTAANTNRTSALTEFEQKIFK